MLRIAEFVEPGQDELARRLVQVGVEGVVTTLFRPGGSGTSDTGAAATRAEQPWEIGPLALLQQRFADLGLRIEVIEDAPPMDAIRTGAAGRDEELEALLTLVGSMGRLRIPVLCVNFMALTGWARTSTALHGRGGALVTGYDHVVVERLGDVPGAPLHRETLWENLAWLLERLGPAAERAGVRVALHPDDPPLPELRGVARILASLDDLERAVMLAASPNVGVTFCQGNIALMTDDVPAAIRRFAALGAVHFVHFRDVRGSARSFVETFHDEGPTDMSACIEAYLSSGVDAPMRSDHVPTLAGEANDRPGYAGLARLWAVGYMQGLLEACRAGVVAQVDASATSSSGDSARS